MAEEPTLEHAFQRRSEQWNEDEPVAAALAALGAESPYIRAVVEPVKAAMYSKPSLLIAAITHVMRRAAADHDLAQYFRTLGGRRQVDDQFTSVVLDFVETHLAELQRVCQRPGGYRQNDPHTAAILWPAIARFAAGRRVHLIELGGTAGVGLAADKLAYLYGERAVRSGNRPQIAIEAGQLPEEIEADIQVVGRYGLELAPVRTDDAESVSWLLDCVPPDRSQQRQLLAEALDAVSSIEIDWRKGDYFDQLPGVLADIPPGDLAFVLNAHTLCCNENRDELPRILKESRKDLVWVAKEHGDAALGLVSEDYKHEDHETVLLSAVEYVQGDMVRAWKLADSDGHSRRIEWDPQPVTVM